MLSGCFAPKPLRDKAKAAKLAARIERLDPSALTYKTDTIFTTVVRDTVLYTREIMYDTTFSYLPGDTVYVTDTTGASVRLVFIGGDRVEASLKVPPLPIVFTDTMTVATAINHSIEVRRNRWAQWLLSSWRWLLAIACIAALFYVVNKLAQNVP